MKRKLLLLKYRLIEEISYWIGSDPHEVWGDDLTPEERVEEEMSRG